MIGESARYIYTYLVLSALHLVDFHKALIVFRLSGLVTTILCSSEAFAPGVTFRSITWTKERRSRGRQCNRNCGACCDMLQTFSLLFTPPFFILLSADSFLLIQTFFLVKADPRPTGPGLVWYTNKSSYSLTHGQVFVHGG